MNINKEEKNKALLNAWSKIQDYTKRHANVFVEDIIINIDEYTQFGVTPDGVAFFQHYDDLEDKYDAYYHPYQSKATNEEIKLKSIEKIIKNWDATKKVLLNEVISELGIYNFKI